MVLLADTTSPEEGIVKKQLRAKKVRMVVNHPSFAGAAGRYYRAVETGTMSERTAGWLNTATAKIMHDCDVCDRTKVHHLYMTKGAKR